MLISRTDIESVKDISLHSTDPRINQFIKDAQMFDLRPLLGGSLYFDVEENESSYTDLINGSSFTKDGVTLKHYGLKSVLVEFFWARYTRDGGYNDTPTGNTIKITSFSNETEKEDKRDLYGVAMKNGYDYFNLVRTYLDQSDIDLWTSKNCKENNNNFRINLIR